MPSFGYHFTVIPWRDEAATQLRSKPIVPVTVIDYSL